MCDAVLIDRIRSILSRREGYSERRMFGTACFMINGNMCVGTWNGSTRKTTTTRWQRRTPDRLT